MEKIEELELDASRLTATEYQTRSFLNKAIRAINAIMPKEPAPVQPKPEPKPLRWDGDVIVRNGIPMLYCDSIGTRVGATTERYESEPALFNVPKLANFFRKNPGGKLMMVKEGEIGVGLTKEEAKTILDSVGPTFNNHRRYANHKIAAAMGDGR